MMTIIFDFDGTLANSLETIIDIYNTHIVKEFRCKPFDKSRLDEYKKMRPAEFIRSFGVTPLKLPFIAWRAKSILNKRIDTVDAFPDIIELLTNLFNRNVTLGIVTSNSEKNARTFLNKYGVEHYFDFVHGSRRAPNKAKVLKKVIKKHKLDKQNLIYIGDEIRDIAACKAVGIPIASVTWGHHHRDLLKQQNPEFIVDAPREIETLVQNL